MHTFKTILSFLFAQFSFPPVNPLPLNGPGSYALAFDGATPAVVNHGPLFVPEAQPGSSYYECYSAPGASASTKACLADSLGNHTISLGCGGSLGDGIICPPSGTIWTDAGGGSAQAFNSFAGQCVGEWGVSGAFVDATNHYVWTTLDGLIVGRTAFSGTPVTPTIASAADAGVLYIGGGTNIAYDGKIAFVRAFVGASSVPDSFTRQAPVIQPFYAETVPSGWSFNGQVPIQATKTTATFLADYTTPTRIIADQSGHGRAGVLGGATSGQVPGGLFWAGARSYPGPQWVYDYTTPFGQTAAPTQPTDCGAASVGSPGGSGNIAWDDFARTMSTNWLGGIASLGTAPSGQAWQGFQFPGFAGTTIRMAGIKNHHAAYAMPTQDQVGVAVDAGRTSYFLSVRRNTAAGADESVQARPCIDAYNCSNTALIFRFIDDQNFCVVYTYLDGGVYIGTSNPPIPSFASVCYVNGLPLAGPLAVPQVLSTWPAASAFRYTKLKVWVNGNTIHVYGCADDNSCIETNASPAVGFTTNSAGTKVGMAWASEAGNAGVDGRRWYDLFCVSQDNTGCQTPF